MALQAIKYTRGSLELLDQRLLPHEFKYLPVPDPQTSWLHIKDMVVRGAPAIVRAHPLHGLSSCVLLAACCR